MDNNSLLQHLRQVVNVLLQNPASDGQYWTAAIAGFFMLAWVFTRVGERMDVANVDGFHGFLAAAVGTAVTLAAITAASIYVAPSLRVEPGLVFLLVAALVSSVIVTIPAIKFWTQAAYLNTLVTWLISLVAGVVVIAAVNYGFAAAKGGADQIHKNDARHRAINEVMK